MLQLTIPISRSGAPTAQTLTWSDIQLELQRAGMLLDVIVLETKGKSMCTHTRTHKHKNIRTEANISQAEQQFV